MKGRLPIYARALVPICTGITGLLAATCGQSRADKLTEKGAPGVIIRQAELPQLHGRLVKRIESAPQRTMDGSGLAGAMGEVHVKLRAGDPQQILLPIPQLADGQIPICYAFNAAPGDVATEFRVWKRDDSNVVLTVRLEGKNKEARIAWSSLVLLAPGNVIANAADPEKYGAASPCAQAKADAVAKLAMALWPKSGKSSEFAANIQRHIREMKRTTPPRSLDAMGILRSGENSICTANANLAVALMRSRGIACRSVAVVPPNGQRLEMHRIVEFREGTQWLPFDPSSLEKEIPVKPWHNVIMAKTTSSDEQTAMKPRMGVMVGCPYGQETELITAGVTLSGQDFFWTLAKPLAEFEPSDAAIRQATDGWKTYLSTGKLSQGQLKAVSAKSDSDLVNGESR